MRSVIIFCKSKYACKNIFSVQLSFDGKEYICKIKTGDNTPFRISIYDKREDFAFRIVNFPHRTATFPPIQLTVFIYLNW